MSFISLAVRSGLSATLLMAVACGDDDSNNTTQKQDASTSPVKDAAVASGNDASSNTASDAGATGAPDHKTLRTFVDNVVTNQIVAKDPVVLSYFVPNTQANASPSLDDIKECLATQVGAVLGNGDVYPPTTALASGYRCRGDMAAVHQGVGGGANENLGISDAVFTAFINDIVNEAHAESLPQALLDKVSPVLLGLQGQIVDPARKDAGAVCYKGTVLNASGKCDVPDGG